MKVSEVRIGNLVHAFRTIWQIDCTDFRSEDLIATYEPIPLTEEWLLKFGLTKYDNEYHFNNFSGLHFIFKSQWYLYRNDMNSNKCLVAYGFEYVHNAQNLIHSITGEELTIE